MLPIMNITIIGRLDFMLELTVFETDNLAKAVFPAMFTKGDNFVTSFLLIWMTKPQLLK